MAQNNRLILKICPQCKKEYQVKQKLSKQKYCSNECKHLGKISSIEFKCKYCGKLFYVPRCHSNRNYVHCSTTCRDNSHRQMFKCKTCGKEIIKTNWEVRVRKFCSLKCAYGRRIVDLRANIKKCKYCGKEFKPHKKDSIKQPHNYCSHICRVKAEYNHKREIRFCKSCGILFKCLKIDKLIFCSRACYRKNCGETSIERKIREILQKNDINYETEFKLGRYNFDFKIRDNILIECDGTYWHKNVKERDKKKQDLAELNGYKVIRFTEERIKKDILSCENELKALL